jgi:hypothetical protein
MPSHYNDEKKRSRLPGLKPGEALTTAGPGLEAVKKVVGGVTGAITGGEPVTPYRGYGLGEKRGMGFMEAGIPIPEDQAGVMQTMPTKPVALGGISPKTPGVVDITPPMGGGAGAIPGAMPTGPVDLTPRLGEIEAGVEGALPAAFDTEKAHRLGMERYGEGQVYLPPGQRSRYADIMDSVLGPAPTPPAGAARPITEGIPSEITPPARSGNAMVDLFRWVSHNKRLQQQNKQMAEQKRLNLEAQKYEGEQEFKEKKLVSEEKGRKGALDLSRRKAIATEAKGAVKLDPFVKRARDIALKKNPDFAYLPKEEQDTIILQEIERTQKLHGQDKKPKPKEGDTKTLGDKEYKKVNGKWMEV